MSIDFGLSHVPLQNIRASNTAKDVEVKIGTLMNQKVAVINNAKSLIAIAMDEVNYHINTLHDKPLEEFSEKKNLQDAYFKQIQGYKERMHNAGYYEEVDNFKKLVRANKNKTPEWIIQQALECFSDPSDIWVAIFEIIEDIEQELTVQNKAETKAELAICQQALQLWESDNNVAICTGLVAFAEAKDFTELADGNTLRSFYRDTICNYNDAEDVFNNILKNWDMLDFDKGVDFLFHSISVDLGTDKPSMGKEHLEQLLNNLGKVRLLHSTFIIFAEVLQRFENEHKQKNCPLKPAELLKDILNISKQTYINANSIIDVAKKANPPSIELEVLFLQDLLKAVRSTTPLLYNGNEGLLKMTIAFQDALDIAIAKEDEYLASLED